MGNKQSGNVEGDLYNPEEYVVVKQCSDHRYGDIKILRHKFSNLLVCEVTKIISTEQAFNMMKESSFNRKQLQHENIIKLINFTATKKEEFCSNFWKVQLLYEYVQNDLKNEIEKRSKKSSNFSEGELWYILNSSIQALLCLKSKDVNHGDIRPYTILISNEGYIKFSENFQFNKQLTAYQQLLMGMIEEPYIAPELFVTLKHKDTQLSQQFDQNKNEVFALGLSLLEAALMKSTLIFYDNQNYIFREDVLQSYLDQLPLHYGQNFTQILRSMLQVNPDQRPNLDEINNFLGRLKMDQWWTYQVPSRLFEVNEQQPIDQKPEYSSQIIGKPTPIMEDKRWEPSHTYIHRDPEYSANVTTVSHEQHYNPKTSNYPDTQKNTTDYSDLDARINAVLAMSRQTVEKYGGFNVPTDSYSTKSYQETTSKTNQYSSSYVPEDKYKPYEQVQKQSQKEEEYQNQISGGYSGSTYTQKEYSGTNYPSKGQEQNQISGGYSGYAQKGGEQQNQIIDKQSGSTYTQKEYSGSYYPSKGQEQNQMSGGYSGYTQKGGEQQNQIGGGYSGSTYTQKEYSGSTYPSKKQEQNQNYPSKDQNQFSDKQSGQTYIQKEYSRLTYPQEQNQQNQIGGQIYPSEQNQTYTSTTTQVKNTNTNIINNEVNKYTTPTYPEPEQINLKRSVAERNDLDNISKIEQNTGIQNYNSYTSSQPQQYVSSTQDYNIQPSSSNTYTKTYDQPYTDNTNKIQQMSNENQNYKMSSYQREESIPQQTYQQLNYNNDLDLDAAIKKSLRRSKEVEQIVSAQRKDIEHKF